LKLSEADVSADPLPDKPLFIPVVLGTARGGRMSEHVASFVLSRLSMLPHVDTELFDVRKLALPTDDAGEQIKHPAFSAAVMRADALVIVTPEYNHGYPGLLKHALDSNLKEYIHKAVGIVGVSAGPWGGTRAIENLLPVMRELGLVTIFWDGNFSRVRKAFDPATGALLDDAYLQRLEKFFKELVWMAKVLRHGRETIPI
jgi:NAD(P)H-dependent FMN reductase